MILNTLKKFLSIALIVLLTMPLQLLAQTDKSNLLGQINTITTAVPFLMISPDARAGGIGDAGVASSPDVNSIHWNPSKMAFNEKKMGVGISYTPWLRALVPDINLAYLSAYSKIGNGDQAISGAIRYFSLGNIDFTDDQGNPIGQFNPSEYSIDVSYARKLGENFSGGISLRYIHSNLTGGIVVPGSNQQTKAGNSVAADVSAFYQKEIELAGKDAVLSAGFNISNIGAKITYSETGTKDFIPMNLRIGPALKIKLNEYNDLGFIVDFNKLLVPTPPVYDGTVDADGQLGILYGKDPNVGVAEGIIQSFNDAPGGGKEELREINICGGMEYWYDKQFAFRAGYFYEHATKGNRKYFTLGAGLRYNVFGLDFAYLIPTEQRNPLENTLRFTLTFDFDAIGGTGDEGSGE
jgi:Type IX secretion system protein PorV